MSSLQGDNTASGSRTLPTENVKVNRYEVYESGGGLKVKKDNLKTPSSQTNAFGNLAIRDKRDKGVTLHIKESQTVPGKDCGSLNVKLIATRPKSALSVPSNSCSLFGVSLDRPLKYSRNALTVRKADIVDKRRRSSCSDITSKNPGAGKD